MPGEATTAAPAIITIAPIAIATDARYRRIMSIIDGSFHFRVTILRQIVQGFGESAYFSGSLFHAMAGGVDVVDLVVASHAV